jgi:hypothetical protein
VRIVVAAGDLDMQSRYGVPMRLEESEHMAEKITRADVERDRRECMPQSMPPLDALVAATAARSRVLTYPDDIDRYDDEETRAVAHHLRGMVRQTN